MRVPRPAAAERTAFATFFFFQAEDGIRDLTVTGVQTCALPISGMGVLRAAGGGGPRFFIGRSTGAALGRPQARPQLLEHVGDRSEERGVGEESRPRPSRCR